MVPVVVAQTISRRLAQGSDMATAEARPSNFNPFIQIGTTVLEVDFGAIPATLANGSITIAHGISGLNLATMKPHAHGSLIGFAAQAQFIPGVTFFPFVIWYVELTATNITLRPSRDIGAGQYTATTWIVYTP